MKCTTKGCENIILDFTGNVDGRCAKCRFLELMLYFGAPRPDTERLDPIQVDKQTLVERSLYE